MSSDAARAVRIESNRAVFRQLPLTLGASALNALVTGAVLARHTSDAAIGVWLAAFMAMVVLRGIAWRRFVRLPAEAMAAPVWTLVSVTGSFVSGLLWGACSLFLMPASGPYPLFMTFVVGGMSAGSITVNAAHLPSVAAFILPAVLPLVGWFVWRGTDLSLAMAFMTSLFMGALLLAAWRYAREFAAGVRARMALAERTAELAEANARLRAEIAEREGAEAALRQAQKMEAIGSLTAGVAHDVNNVLMVVRGASEVLKRRLSHAPGHLRQITAILRATERGAALIRRLLAFARKEALTPALVDLNAALQSIAGLLGATLGKSLHLVMELDETLPHVCVDRTGFEHAIINLAINARDAMPEGGTLTFRTALAQVDDREVATGLVAGPYVVVAVADSGTGMTEAVQARAFDPFFTTKPPGQGSGLGLSQVYGFVRQFGGAVQIESTPGGGTTVLLYLPPANMAPGPLPELAEPGPPRAVETGDRLETLHLVLLDDEDLVREVVAELLEGAGYQVSAFAQAADALRCVEGDPSVVLLVTDLGLPDCAGDEVARRARRARPGLPVLFITGYNDAGQLANEPWQLRKPFAEADLLATVARAVRQPWAAA